MVCYRDAYLFALIKQHYSFNTDTKYIPLSYCIIRRPWRLIAQHVAIKCNYLCLLSIIQFIRRHGDPDGCITSLSSFKGLLLTLSLASGLELGISMHGLGKSRQTILLQMPSTPVAVNMETNSTDVSSMFDWGFRICYCVFVGLKKTPRSSASAQATPSTTPQTRASPQCRSPASCSPRLACVPVCPRTTPPRATPPPP